MAAQDGRCDSCGCLLFCSRRVQDWTRRDEAGGVATARATFLAAAVLHARGAAVCAGACSTGDAGCEMVRLRSAVSHVHVRYGMDARGDDVGSLAAASDNVLGCTDFLGVIEWQIGGEGGASGPRRTACTCAVRSGG
jgi:hypothetical protein